MSYAEQFWSVKECDIMNSINELAWFGVNGVTYNNPERMNEILEDGILGFKNPVANFYLYKYVKKRGLDPKDYFDYGFTVGVYNHVYKALMLFQLFDYPTETEPYCKFVDIRGLPLFPSYFATDNQGADVLLMEDYTSIQFLNGRWSNWYKEWNAYNNNYDDTFYDAVIMKRMPSFYSGFSGEVTSALTPIKSEIGEDTKTIYIGIPTYDEMNLIASRLVDASKGFDPSNPFTAIQFHIPHLTGFVDMYSKLVEAYRPDDENLRSRVEYMHDMINGYRYAGMFVMTELTSLRTNLPKDVRTGVNGFQLLRYEQLSSNASVTAGKNTLEQADTMVLPVIRM